MLQIKLDWHFFSRKISIQSRVWNVFQIHKENFYNVSEICINASVIPWKSGRCTKTNSNWFQLCMWEIKTAKTKWFSVIISTNCSRLFKCAQHVVFSTSTSSFTRTYLGLKRRYLFGYPVLLLGKILFFLINFTAVKKCNQDPRENWTEQKNRC